MILYNPTVSGSLLVTGSLTTTGTITSQTLVVQTITSSVSYLTGSTQHGSVLTNTHQFTGSVLMSGSVGIGVNSPVTALEVLPSITNSSIKTGGIEIQSYAVNNSWIGDNMYYSGSWKARATGHSTNVYFGAGTINFTRAASTGSGATIFPISSMFIDASGNVGIGTSSPGTKLHIANGDIQIQNAGQTTGDFSQAQSLAFSQENGAYGASIKAIREAWSSMPFALTFLTNSVASGLTEKMRITSTGNIGAGGSTTNIYNASDIRLKKNINTITYGLNTVSSLNPVKFNWADGFEPTEADKTLLGFIAQEVQTVIPEAVESFGGSVDLNGTIIENTLRVNEKFIIPVLVKAIQELSAKNTALEEILQRNNIQ